MTAEDWHDVQVFSEALREKIEQARKHPLLFVKLLGLKPEPWQEKLLRRTSIKVVPHV